MLVLIAVALSNSLVVHVAEGSGEIVMINHTKLPDVHVHTDLDNLDTRRSLSVLEETQEVDDLVEAGGFIEFVGGAGHGAIPIAEPLQAQLWAIVGYYAAKDGCSLACLRDIQALSH